MKAIKNIDELCIVITADDWLRQVYAATGVIPVPSVNNVTLVSNCGSVDLDADAEYHYSRGEDLTEYCNIKTPDNLIEYIKGMESYRDYLVDQPLGSFSKSELHWAVKERILRFYEDWALIRIGVSENEIAFHMALSGYDSTEINTPVGLNLEETLRCLVREMNDLTEGLGDIPPCRVRDRVFSVPRSFDELMATIR